MGRPSLPATIGKAARRGLVTIGRRRLAFGVMLFVMVAVVLCVTAPSERAEATRTRTRELSRRADQYLRKSVRWSRAQLRHIKEHNIAKRLFAGLREHEVTTEHELVALTLLADRLAAPSEQSAAGAPQLRESIPCVLLDVPHVLAVSSSGGDMSGDEQQEDDQFLAGSEALHNELALVLHSIAAQLLLAATSKQIVILHSVPDGLGWPECDNTVSPLLCLLRPPSVHTETWGPDDLSHCTSSSAADAGVDFVKIRAALAEVVPRELHEELSGTLTTDTQREVLVRSWLESTLNYLLRPADGVVSSINAVIAAQDEQWLDRPYTGVFLETHDEADETVERLHEAIELALQLYNEVGLKDVLLVMAEADLESVVAVLRVKYPTLHFIYARDLRAAKRADPVDDSTGGLGDEPEAQVVAEANDVWAYGVLRDIWLLAGASAFVSSSCTSALARTVAAIGAARDDLIVPPLLVPSQPLAECSAKHSKQLFSLESDHHWQNSL